MRPRITDLPPQHPICGRSPDRQMQPAACRSSGLQPQSTKNFAVMICDRSQAAHRSHDQHSQIMTAAQIKDAPFL
jgi:hypothetical protein